MIVSCFTNFVSAEPHPNNSDKVVLQFSGFFFFLKIFHSVLFVDSSYILELR